VINWGNCPGAQFKGKELQSDTKQL